MQIGEVAARTELSVRSLRHWEEVGLLRPSGRSVGGFRLYTQGDVDRILAIRRMKPLGFSLEEMKAVIADIEQLERGDDAGRKGTASAADGPAARLGLVRADAVQRRAKLAAQLAMADEFIDVLGRRMKRRGQ